MLSGLGSATSYHFYYSANGTGTFSAELQAYGSIGSAIHYHNDGGLTLYVDYSFLMRECDEPDDENEASKIKIHATPYRYITKLCSELPYSESGSMPDAPPACLSYILLRPGSDGTARGTITVSEQPPNTVSGNTECVDLINLYIKVSGDYEIVNQKELNGNDSYSFNIFNNSEYKLDADGEMYIFTCNGTNIDRDYDSCSHTTYRFEESCGNLIPDSEGFYIEKQGSTVLAANYFHTSDGILDISNSSADNIYICTDTFVGKVGWVVDPVVTNTTYTLTNSAISWGLKVIVQDANTSLPMDGVHVHVNQSCYCTSEFSTRNKATVNGMVEYGDMSLQDASIHVWTDGYKFLNENSTGYNVFLSGRTNFSSKTWVVKLEPSNSDNESEWYEVNNNVNIYFRDVNGNRTSQILDTDAEVYLYYENNNSDEEAMTLRFESSSTHTYFMPEQSWNIPHGEIGHKTIDNAYFTPWNYSYRAVIYNSSIYGWNITIPLTVRNAIKEETLHYENLTTNLWFMGEKDGKIDYREDMKIVSHARSNNTTLMNIDLEVWKDGEILCYKNMTAADYAGASYPYFYVYEPVFEYVAGSNYTTKMYGFDRTLLEVRYLECIEDTVTRKNKLTIGVKDRSGANLDNCYIYLEGWGSLPTGTTYYNSYEGIDNGYYRYKASKNGYSDDGWADVTVSDDDEIVWYTLTEDHTNTSATQQKMTDGDIKGMFFPLLFFLLICIIFGGFKYVSG